MAKTSNYDQVARDLDKVADCLDMRRGVGADILDFVATRISDRARDESGPGGKWDENRGTYGIRKRKKGLPVGAGLKRGAGVARMLSDQQIRGKTKIEKHSATMTFGTDTDAIRKGQWFTAGSKGATPKRDAAGRFNAQPEPSGAKNQPARPFYAITDEDAAEVTDMIEKSVDDYLGTI